MSGTVTEEDVISGTLTVALICPTTALWCVVLSNPLSELLPLARHLCK
jgi:hypothetical protein